MFHVRTIFEVWAQQWNIEDCIFDWAILATIVYVNIYDALLILKKNIYTFMLLKRTMLSRQSAKRHLRDGDGKQ